MPNIPWGSINTNATVSGNPAAIPKSAPASVPWGSISFNNSGATSPLPSTNAPAKNAYISRVAQAPSQPAQAGPTYQTQSGSTVPGVSNASPNPASNANDYSTAYQAYTSALTPSSDEVAAKTYLNSLMSQAAQDKITAQNRGEDLGYAGGLTRVVDARNNAAIGAASTALNTLTGYRTANANAAKAKMDYLTKTFNSPAGTTSYQFNPATGSYAPINNGASSLADKNANTDFYNLQRTYPDAAIKWDASKSPQENLAAAQAAASRSPTYTSKSTNIRSVTLPGGGLGFYNSKTGGGVGGGGGTGGLSYTPAEGAQLKADAASLKTQQVYADTLQRAASNADATFTQVVNAFKSKGINDYQSPIANYLTNAAKYGLTGGDVNTFRAALQEVANQYQQVFTRNGQVSDTVRKQADDIFNGNVSLNDLARINQELQSLSKIDVAGSQNQVQNIAGRMGGGAAPALGTNPLSI